MALLHVKLLSEGMHPSEALIEIKHSRGEAKQSFANLRSLFAIEGKSMVHDITVNYPSKGMLEVGYPIEGTDDEYLVELPQETAQGDWRVWVPKDQVVIL